MIERQLVGFLSADVLPRAINKTWRSYAVGETPPRLFCLKNETQACGIRFYCPVYNKDIFIVQGNIQECSKWIASTDKNISADYMIRTGGYARFEMLEGTTVCVIWLSAPDEGDYMNDTGCRMFGLLAHEALHAANHIGWDHGIEHTKESEEHFTYYMQWIMNMCLDCIGFDPGSDEQDRNLDK